MRQLVILVLILLVARSAFAQLTDTRVTADLGVDAPALQLQDKKWIHGSADCASSTDPSIDVFRYNQSSYILRQSKCLSFEAPFIYVLFGDEKVLVLDTGATEDAREFPLYETVLSLIEEQSVLTETIDMELLVIHSHSHGDHHAGDVQFRDKPNVTLVEPNFASMTRFFSFDQWPDGEATIDLGRRQLTIIPTPGHQEESISIYDTQTKWLLTGDTFYPGYIYVKHWDQYASSIARLVSFIDTQEVNHVLGAHIEMTATAGEFYAIGTVYQPDEAALVLLPEDIVTLDTVIREKRGPEKIELDGFIVAPMNFMQKTISNVARWIIQ